MSQASGTPGGLAGVILVLAVVLMATLVLLGEGREGETELSVPSSSSTSSSADQLDDLQSSRRIRSTSESALQELEARVVHAAEPHGGRIVGRVSDQNGNDLVNGEGIEITLRQENCILHRTRLDASGRFEFEKVVPGNWRIHVEKESLPAGYLSPWHRRQQSHVGKQIGLVAEVMRLRDGETEHVRLGVFQAARVQGTVFSPDGPFEKVFVRMQSVAPGLQGLSHNAQTDWNGGFSMSVYPGKFRSLFALTDALPEVHRDAIHPTPRTFEFEAGRTYELKPFRFGPQGVAAVEGRVLGQDGEPYEGLSVICYLDEEASPGEASHTWGSKIGSTTTDVGGRYRFEGLPSRDVRLTIAPFGYIPSRKARDNALATFVDPIAVGLRTVTETVQLDDRIAVRNHPFVYRARLTRERQKFNGLRVHVRPVLDEVDRLALAEHDIRDLSRVHRSRWPELVEDERIRHLFYGPRKWLFTGASINISKDGIIEWSCVTPHPKVAIEISSRGEAIDSIELTPAPDQVIDGGEIEIRD
ncbi:MAG: hypothetical protein CMJ89_04575 [Planctomycetes bacterium]|nr:hypothetical protein [Planctomycetota bacterium]